MIFLFLEAEFLAMILLIIYVGAVAVLFLFVVMMLDIDIVLLRKNFLNYLPIGLFVGLVIFLELFLVIKKSNFTNEFSNSNFQQESNFISNTHSLGNVLYTDYFIMFQLSGIILLISMIGAILLTLRKREGVKRQNIYNQIFRK